MTIGNELTNIWPTQKAELAKSSRDINEYLLSLQMEVGFSPFDAAGRSRIAQLTSRSNQFNLTTRRYDEAAIAQWEENTSAFTLQVRLADRFSDNGMISVVICKLIGDAWDIDTWLMSCRVLNRRVEEAVLDTIVANARARGANKLLGQYIPTDRNDLVKDHYHKLGFSLLSSDNNQETWELNLATYIPKEAAYALSVFKKSVGYWRTMTMTITSWGFIAFLSIATLAFNYAPPHLRGTIVFPLTTLIFIVLILPSTQAVLTLLSFVCLIWLATKAIGAWKFNYAHHIIFLALLIIFGWLKSYDFLSFLPYFAQVPATIGLSYILIRALQLLIDLIETPALRPSPLLLFSFLASWPSLVSGPIQRFQDFRDQLVVMGTFRLTEDIFVSAVRRMIKGFFTFWFWQILQSTYG